jgi:hypothetical protein
MPVNSQIPMIARLAEMVGDGVDRVLGQVGRRAELGIELPAEGPVLRTAGGLQHGDRPELDVPDQVGVRHVRPDHVLHQQLIGSRQRQLAQLQHLFRHQAVGVVDGLGLGAQIRGTRGDHDRRGVAPVGRPPRLSLQGDDRGVRGDGADLVARVASTEHGELAGQTHHGGQHHGHHGQGEDLDADPEVREELTR